MKRIMLIIKIMLALLISLSEITDRESLLFIYSEEQGCDSSCGLSARVSSH